MILQNLTTFSIFVLLGKFSILKMGKFSILKMAKFKKIIYVAIWSR